MTTFAVTDQSQVIDALNYALSNLGQSTSGGGNVSGNAVTINTQTGVIGQGATVLSYLYRYLTVRYATSATGAGITANPIGATFFGVYNNNSDTPPDPNNPSNYQWTEATVPLSATNLLWYSTLGGRQVQFYVGTSAGLPEPKSNWVQVNDVANVIDLDFVTATATLPLVVMTAFIATANANVVPSTPTGGTYDFGNLIFTAPTGWANSVPGNTTSYFSSQNQFQATPTNSIVGPVDPWTTPVLTGLIGANGAPGANGTNGANGVSTYFYNVFQSANTAPSTPTGGFYNFGTATGTPPAGWNNTAVSVGGAPIWAVSAQVSSTTPTANVSIGSTWSSTFQYTGAGGAPGQRGFVPMAYVLTPSDPRSASSSTLSQWFQAPTNGTPAGSNTPPVGTGFIPVTGDTASFTWSANTAVAPVYTYNSSTTTWTAADGQVINGNVFITGSVNANRLNANDIFALKLQSTNANFGNNSSNGFWFDSNGGNARMAGNVNIGGNLTVAGLISSNGVVANLNANTVNTTTVVSQAITDSVTESYGGVSLAISPFIFGNSYFIGQQIANGCSSSGNLVTTTNTGFVDFTGSLFLPGSPVTVISGTGSTSGLTVASVVSPTQIRLSGTPSIPLSNATISCQATIAQVNGPSLQVTTVLGNQVQINLSGYLVIQGILQTSSAPYGQLLTQCFVVRRNPSGTNTVVAYRLVAFPPVWATGGIALGAEINLIGIVDTPTESGLQGYFIQFVPITSLITQTWTPSTLYIESYVASTTVLKR